MQHSRSNSRPYDWGLKIKINRCRGTDDHVLPAKRTRLFISKLRRRQRRSYRPAAGGETHACLSLARTQVGEVEDGKPERLGNGSIIHLEEIFAPKKKARKCEKPIENGRRRWERVARTLCEGISGLPSHETSGKWLFHDPENYVVLAVVQGKATEIRIFTPNHWIFSPKNTHRLQKAARRTLSYKNEHSLYSINIFNNFPRDEQKFYGALPRTVESIQRTKMFFCDDSGKFSRDRWGPSNGLWVFSEFS